MSARWEMYRPEEHRLDLGPLEIIVHRHIDNPGKWHVSCHRIGVKSHELRAADPLEARGEAILWCRDVVGEFMNGLGLAPDAESLRRTGGR